MNDHDELHDYENWEAALEQAKLETLETGEAFESLISAPGYPLLKSLLYEHYIQRTPVIANSKKGMFEAFGLMKFRQGLQFVFDFIESTVDAKRQLLKGNMNDFGSFENEPFPY